MPFPITNQADLYYRNQTPNPGANSGNRVYPSEGRFAAQPYIIRDIGQRWGFGLGFDDGLVRGGVVTLADRAVNDVVRLTKFSLDLPKGPLFLVKQFGLQLMNPRMWLAPNEEQESYRASFDSGRNYNAPKIGNIEGPSTLKPQFTDTQLFNPLSPIAQAGLTPIGLHFQRHGFFTSDNYEDIVRKNNEGIDNLSKINPKYPLNLPENSSDPTSGTLGSIKVFVEKRDRPLNDSTKSRLVNLYVNHILFDYENEKASPLIEYPTGPGSMLGIGNTTIKRYENTRFSIQNYINKYSNKRITISEFGKTSPLLNIASSSLGSNFSQEEIEKTGDIQSRITTKPSALDFNGYSINDQSTFAFTYNQISQWQSGSLNTTSATNYRDFRKAFDPEIQTLLRADDYTANNIHTRTGVMDTGLSNENENKVDQINVLDIYKAGSSTDVTGKELFGGGNEGTKNWVIQRDLIKFAFEPINNDGGSEVITFRAYIKSFGDDYSAKWNSVNYMGRGEQFYTYEGFERKIKISFTVFAHSRKEMKPIYRKLLYLFSQTAPDYSKSGYMRGPFVKLTIGNWFFRLPGFIGSISTTIDGKETPWEIALNAPEGDEYEDSDMLELPKLLEIDLDFTPIHNFTPQKGSPLALTPFLYLRNITGSVNWLNNTDTRKKKPSPTGDTNTGNENVDAKSTNENDEQISKESINAKTT